MWKGRKNIMAQTPNFQELRTLLGANPPVVYAKGRYTEVNTKGVKKEKKCMINLLTGDVVKNRRLEEHEATNHNLHLVNFSLKRNYNY